MIPLYNKIIHFDCHIDLHHNCYESSMEYKIFEY